MSYKKSKSIKHRVIGSLFRVLVFITRTGHQLVKGRGAQIYTLHAPPPVPLICIGLNEFDNAYARYDVSLFFCDYYCSKR